MAYTTELTAKLTGASLAQLARFRAGGLLAPELQDGRTILYSFRDVIALRSLMWLRGDYSLQKIRRAIGNLDLAHLDVEHLSEVEFVKSGDSIFAHDEEGFTDLVRSPGSREIQTFKLGDVFAPFKAYRGREVPDLLRPSEHLTVDPGRMAGIPVIDGTRIPFDTIAQLVDGRTIGAEDVRLYYPSVTPAAADDAVQFAESLRPAKRGAA